MYIALPYQIGDSMGSTSHATETHCHCGSEFKGSDHCPECHCEQYEAICDHKVESEKERAKRLARMLYDAVLAKGGDYELAATASLMLQESLLNEENRSYNDGSDGIWR